MMPKSDEEEVEDEAEGNTDEEGAENGEDGAEEGDSATQPIEIDLEGLAGRVAALPGEADNYASLEATSKAVLYLVGQGGDTRLDMFRLEEEDTKTVLRGIQGYSLSADGGKLLYRQGGNVGIVDVAPDQSTGESLDLSGMEMRIDPKVEWPQIYADAWRITRDWFYDPNMHGVDWDGLRGLYEPLVAHVAHRGDLDYILGELGGELNAGHFYVNWGDMPRPERRDNGLLGAEIVADESGYFRIQRIFGGENWHADFRSPLTAAGVDVDEGDYIVAVDGRSTQGVSNF